MAGGSGGVNSWPDYMQYTHWWWLSDEKTDSAGQRAVGNTFNMDDDLTTARAANPYTGKAAYNPEDDLSVAEVAYQDYRDQVVALIPATDLATDLATVEGDYLQTAELPIPEDMDIESDVDEAVTAYESKLTPELMRSIGRFCASRQENNAVSGSGFTFGLMELERTHLDKVAEFRANIHTKFRETAFQFKATRDLKAMELKYAWLGAGLELLSKLRLSKVASYMDVLKAGGEIAKLGVVARKEQHDMDLALGAKSATYNLDLYAYGGNLLAAVSGGVYKTAGEMSDFSKVLSGVAATAGAIGSVKQGYNAINDIFGWPEWN